MSRKQFEDWVRDTAAQKVAEWYKSQQVQNGRTRVRKINAEILRNKNLQSGRLDVLKFPKPRRPKIKVNLKRADVSLGPSAQQINRSARQQSAPKKPRVLKKSVGPASDPPKSNGHWPKKFKDARIKTVAKEREDQVQSLRLLAKNGAISNQQRSSCDLLASQKFHVDLHADKVNPAHEFSSRHPPRNSGEEIVSLGF